MPSQTPVAHYGGSTMLRDVDLSEWQQRFVLQCCGEAGGGSTREFLAIAGHDVATIRSAAEEYRAAAKPGPVSLPESTWRVLYDAVNAAIYALGPTELQTVTGVSLHEAADVQLRVCAGVWGAYGGSSWSGDSN